MKSNAEDKTFDVKERRQQEDEENWWSDIFTICIVEEMQLGW